jgi:hypothetical protein
VDETGYNCFVRVTAERHRCSLALDRLVSVINEVSEPMIQTPLKPWTWRNRDLEGWGRAHSERLGVFQLLLISHSFQSERDDRR